MGTAASRAQDLGETARKERSRKESHPKRSKHVYTEKDLARPKILTPEDRERYEAARKDAAPIDAQNAPSTPNNPSQAPQASLGEIARQYRQQKQALRAQEAARQKYPMSGSSPALASPVVPELAPVRPPAPKLNRRSRDPFLPALPVPHLEKPLPPRPRSVQPATPPAWLVPRSPEPSPRALLPSPRIVISPSQEVLVRRGDSLWRVAQQNLGKGSRWTELLAVNPWISDPNHLAIGSRIAVPVPPSASRVASKIRVQKGATLWSIARARFGRGGAWVCIAGANPQLRDANKIHPGEVLFLPAACAP